jgi:hypothetical protein
MPLIKPQVQQPQEISEKPVNIINNPLIRNELVANNDPEGIKQTDSKNALNTTESKEVIIRKKRQYNAFIKLIKQGKYTTGVLTARILGVDNHTISKWLNTSKVKLLMNNTYNKYINDIEQSKDWKAKAYLIDKLEGIDKEKLHNTDMKQLIVINT